MLPCDKNTAENDYLRKGNRTIHQLYFLWRSGEVKQVYAKHLKTLTRQRFFKWLGV